MPSRERESAKRVAVPDRHAETALSTWLRGLRAFGVVIVWFLLLVLTLWAAAALYVDVRKPALRVPIAVMYVVAILVLLFTLKLSPWAAAICLAAFFGVLTWWFTLKPSNEGDWQPDNARTAWTESHGDLITIHNFRNCDYRTEVQYANCWGDRTLHISDIRGTDLFLTNWGIPFASHPILSFQFAENEHVAFSIEARYKAGQGYSTLLGCFRQYALIMVAADERDLIRLRTNFRKDEEVYLYRARVRPEVARAMFVTYITYLNQLHDRPEWYNAVTRNCTTTLQAPLAADADDPQPWNYQFLLNGTLDKLLYDRDRLVTGGLSFAALKQHEHINAAAQAAGDSPDFSALIRAGRIGY